jgi:F-type H+-transporting ATPase subunit delta
MSQSASRRDLVRVVTRGLLDEPQKRGDWLQRLAAYLVMNNMTDQVDLIVNDIAHELYEQAGILTVEVVSARELSSELKASLTGMLKNETEAKQVVIHETTDSALLGGFVARTADAEIDASVRTKLNKLASLA